MRHGSKLPQPGYRVARWRTALPKRDYFDVIVHIMRTDVREKYDLHRARGVGGGRRFPLLGRRRQMPVRFDAETHDQAGAKYPRACGVEVGIKGQIVGEGIDFKRERPVALMRAGVRGNLVGACENRGKLIGNSRAGRY